TIMRQGRGVAECDPREESAEHLAELMIGARGVSARRSSMPATGDRHRLSVSDLSLRSEQKFGVDLKGISFPVHPGEILGIAGIAGNAQTELMAALSGEMQLVEAATIRINGTEAGQV